MRKGMLFAVMALLCLVGCSEYELKSPAEEVWVGGNPPELGIPSHEDRFMQEPSHPADIIFAIDQSCSMSDNIAQLSASIPHFFDTLNFYNLDYRVGVISTDGFSDYSGELTWFGGINYIIPETPNQQSVFSSMSYLARGSGENGLAAITHSLTTAFEENQEFYRVGAPLAYIVISDEPDQSQRNEHVDQPGVSPFLLAAFLDWLEPYKQNQITVSAIATDPARTCPSVYSAGTRYKRTTQYTNGRFHNICDGDWELVLEDLAQWAVPRRYEYFLSQNPIEETIEVFVERGEITFVYEAEVDWYYNNVRNSIVFYEYEHQAGDVVRITYDLAGHYE